MKFKWQFNLVVTNGRILFLKKVGMASKPSEPNVEDVRRESVTQKVTHYIVLIFNYEHHNQNQRLEMRFRLLICSEETR